VSSSTRNKIKIEKIEIFEVDVDPLNITRIKLFYMDFCLAKPHIKVIGGY